MKPYAPLPGTIPARVRDWMLTLPPETEVTSAEIASALGLTIKGITQDLDYATQRGLFNVRKVGKFIHWSLVVAAHEPDPEPIYVGEVVPSRVFVNASQHEPLTTTWVQIRAGALAAFALPSGGGV